MYDIIFDEGGTGMIRKHFLMMSMCLSMFLLTACGGKEEASKEPADLSGTWKSEVNDGSWMEASITSDTISIDWVDTDNSRAVYWIGTYEAPTEYVEEYSWTSQRDKEKTDVELLASTDDTKIFTYSNGELRYELSMMNVTKEVTLKK